MDTRRFVSLKATDIIAWRESPGMYNKCVRSLKASNNRRKMFVAFSDGIVSDDLPGDSRRAMLPVAVGDKNARCVI